MARTSPTQTRSVSQGEPISLLIKPVSGDCNLRCRYCFYLRVPEEVYPESKKHRMPPEVLETMIREYLSLRLPVSQFSWQGGEPTLAGVDFFEEVVRLQQKHGVSGQAVSNSLQTNGILLDEGWCGFLRNYRFLVGLSMDGPADFHDPYRITPGGGGSHSRVLQALRLLQRERVEYNILCVVQRRNVGRARELYRYFRELGVRHAQFIPAIERDPATGEIADFVPSPEEYGDFLCELFDEWLAGDPCEFYVRDFEAMLASLVDGCLALCVYGDRCDQYLLIEHNGDVYPCDFFCQKDLYLGNIGREPIRSILKNPLRHDFANRKRRTNAVCQACEWFRMCYGGCTKDRLHGTDRPTYLCEGYRRFFTHAWDRLQELRQDILARRHLQTRQALRQRASGSEGSTITVRRNDPCPCGSGKKYKHCCGS